MDKVFLYKLVWNLVINPFFVFNYPSNCDLWIYHLKQDYETSRNHNFCTKKTERKWIITPLPRHICPMYATSYFLLENTPQLSLRFVLESIEWKIFFSWILVNDYKTFLIHSYFLSSTVIFKGPIKCLNIIYS